MIKLEKIVVPIDFSASSELALKYAATLAGEFAEQSPQIHLVHIIEEEEFHPGHFDDPLNLAEKWKERSRTRMKEFTGGSLDKFVVIYHTDGGLVYDKILSYAKEVAASLIILGAHGKSGFIENWLGGTSYEVARKANCPVLTVKPDGHGFVAT